MPFRIISIVISLMASLTICSGAWASRLPPPEVEPVEHEGVRYVPGYDGSHDVGAGTITAYSLSTKEELWSVSVYKVHYDDSLERDVQWIFISELFLEAGDLIVVNEDGGRYRIDLENHRVEVLTGESVYGDTGGCAMVPTQRQASSPLTLLISVLLSW